MDEELIQDVRNLGIHIREIKLDILNLQGRMDEMESWLSKEITHHCKSAESAKEIRSIYLNLHKILNGDKNDTN